VRRLGPVLAGVLVVVAACGSGPTRLDMALADRQILAYLQSTFPKAKITKVTCPVEVDAKKGRTFTCATPVGTDTLHVKVTVEDDKGTSITYVPVEAVLDMDQVAIDVAGIVVTSFTGSVSVDCGTDKIRAFKPGTTFQCHGSDPLGTTKVIEATVKDISGALDVKVVQTS
jgi:hypothetical protein